MLVMNELNSLPTPGNRPDVEGLLRAYFRSEMPHPWPRAPLPAARPLVATSLWQRTRPRLALAACVALLLTGYLSLAGSFPREQGPSGALPLNGHVIGDRPSHKSRSVRPPLQPRQKLQDSSKAAEPEAQEQPEWLLTAPDGHAPRGPR
jgi:hypothetical protein